MPDFNLTGLSSRSFEQLLQALSCKILGSGIVVFGDGPDGGREATFDGRVSDFPSTSECWDGYIVMQAKFCQRPKGSPKEDAAWALGQLKKELDSFTKRGTKRKKPQFYIFATNVVLTPAQNAGGKDKVSRLLAKHKKSLGIKAFRVWDYDQICRFLEADAAVRSAYAAWTTPGDALSRIAETLQRTVPDFTKTITNFLQKELLDEHFSKLEQAGHSPEDRIPLEEVFVDLPTFPDRRSSPPDEDVDSKLPPGFLFEILTAASICLRPELLVLSSSRGKRISQQEEPELGRYVLIGGPGQGKSTMAQFLCQIHRVAFLKAGKGLDPDVKKAVKSLVSHCQIQDLPLTNARRFPVRIELARFAKALAIQTKSGINSVLSYITSMIEDRTNTQITVDDLRKWLQEYPWLVILDGLDEVPASSNRDQVMTAVRDFLVDVSSCNADVLLLATTRPQGYNDEFSPKRYRYSWLAPLSIPRALHYGKTLVELSYAHNAQRKNEVLSRLREASRVTATSRLMESPLQVTIMARLLAQVAQPPQERYKLFHQYYEVIYRREMERGVAQLSPLLRDYQADIDSIHRRTGLLLQIESERTKYTDATISLDEFKGIVRDRLQQEGHSEIPLERLTDQIVVSATDRLVFLVPSQSGRVGFEIRSLQEFMAAEALLDGADNVVVSRIRTIAAVPYWQNVLLFAAGKCFAERQWLRDSISQICSELNDDPNDILTRLTLAGSRLAVSLLEDGPARRQPAYSQALARRALSLLKLLPEQIHDHLADVYEVQFDEVYKEELQRQMASGPTIEKLGAWRLLLALMEKRGVSWAREMAEKFWPASAAEKLTLLQRLLPSTDSWLQKRYAEEFFALPYLSPHFYLRHDWEKKELFSQNRLARLYVDLTFGRRKTWERIHSRFSLGRTCDIGIGIVLIESFQKRSEPFLSIGHTHQYWEPFIEAARFARDPSCQRLAHVLRSFYQVDLKNSPPEYQYLLPWPLQACLNAVSDSQDLLGIADRAAAGEFGGLQDWREAERRWLREGLTDQDLSYMADDRWPIPKEIATVGVPLAGIALHFLSDFEEGLDLEQFEHFWRLLPGDQARKTFAGYLFYMVFHPRGARAGARPRVGIDLVTDMLQAMEPMFLPLDSALLPIYEMTEQPEKALAVFDLLGMKLRGISRRGAHEDWRLPPGLVDFLIHSLEEDPRRIGIARLLSWIAATRQLDRPPKNAFDLIANQDLNVARCGIVLCMTNPALSQDDLSAIAKDLLARFRDDEDFTMTALHSFDIHQMANPAAQCFLEILWSLLPRELDSARARTMAMLFDLLGRRTTGLQNPATWEMLELPKGLLRVVSN